MAPEIIGASDYFALVIGNNGYRHLKPLNTAINDARAVANVLRTQYGFEVKLLIDADRKTILDELDAFRRKLKVSDQFLIYYAGHGWLDQLADRGYWLPVDAQQKSRASWLSNADITDTLLALQARQVMVVADSCYSGALTRSGTVRRTQITSQELAALTAMLKYRSRTVLASGGLEPVSDGRDPDGHSVFAQAFLKVLTNNARPIDGTEVFQRVREQVRLNGDQTPQYQNIRKAGHEVGGDFLFIPRN